MGAVLAPHSNTTSNGQVMAGRLVSRKVMVCTQLVRLPQTSVAVQVRKIEPLPVQLGVPVTSTKLMLATPLQVSVAVAVPVLLVVGRAVHSRVMLVGQLMTGGMVSLKLIICVQLA